MPGNQNLVNFSISSLGNVAAQKACETYITALSTGKELNIASPEVAEKTAQDWENYPIDQPDLHLKAIRSVLDSEDPSYKQ